MDIMHHTSKLIHDTFLVSIGEADKLAIELIDFVKAKGGNVSDASNIESAILKVFGKRLNWRSEAKKAKLESNKTATVASYNAHIKSTKRVRW
jgi:hypothetical protein